MSRLLTLHKRYLLLRPSLWFIFVLIGFLYSEGAATVSDKVTRTVKWFNNSKGYGFISQETGEDVFVHHSAIEMTGYRTLNEGQRVQFSMEQGPKGLQAIDISPI